MRAPYTFTILRYVHDIATGEFGNVGVAMYAPDARYLGAICTNRYGRLSHMFGDIDGDGFRSLMRYVQSRFEEMAAQLRGEMLKPEFATVMGYAERVLPRDDSSLQWAPPGGGLTEDPAATLEQLYSRLVERYEERPKSPSRLDEDIWRLFRRELETAGVIAHLKPKRIVAADYDYEFEHAWENEVWRVYEPVSFDLQDAESILDKANRWLGRIVNLQDSPDRFRLHLLLGRPTIDRLRPAYDKAWNILHKMPGEKEFIGEDQASDFSRQLASELKAHNPR
ncbi:MAG: DUF3037 domain-containing protein [Candidatus Sumerlaeota bacterium]|nr:DUF3037 domain-containing protein [Candidatus Sumerlaeota bacterium]